MVYNYCIDIAISDDNKCWKKDGWPMNDSRYDAHFLDITGISAQIRAEFRSYYLHNLHKCIPLRLAESYFDLFHVDNPDVAEMLTMHLKRIIRVRARRFDFIGIFRHLANHPGIDCSFDADCYLHRVRKVGLQRILTRSAANSLDADFKTATDMVISIVPNNNTKNVVFTIKNEFKLETQERRDLETAFRETLDLVDSGYWSVVIKYGSM
jgi:hypothetical protein